uniref:RNase H type-1 domain-containing protein n=1 Tax=Cannabis sativa TaxID=3483 RepID=A0A803QL18_CANSA
MTCLPFFSFLKDIVIVVHGATPKPALTIAFFAENYLRNLRAACIKLSPAQSATPRLPRRYQIRFYGWCPRQLSPTIPDQVPWAPPPTGELKLNVDATLNACRNTIGVGAVIRDDKGQVVAALAKLVIENFTSYEIEAKVMFHSLTWALDMQIVISHVETDALLVANAFEYPFNINFFIQKFNC